VSVVDPTRNPSLTEIRAAMLEWNYRHVEDWPVWATARVEVRPADPRWQRLGDALRHDLDLVLARWLIAPVEHVGSTAVPGLAAKPVLDLQAAVADLDSTPAVTEALVGSGWHLVPPELDARPWRRFLVQVVDDARVAHLHLLTADGERWTEQLAFRDALRVDSELVQRYAELKQQLAAAHVDDREAYTAAKTDFVRSVLGQGST